MSAPADPGDGLQARLRLALGAALRARDMTAAAALRSALGAIGNAEAVPVPAAHSGVDPSAAGPHVAGAAAGLGAAEAERRRLSPAQVAAIVQAEIDERLAAATQYESAGHAGRAARLRAEAQALTSAGALRA
jgi:uncharacterized protein